MPTSLTRTVRFSAGHHYHRPEWSERRNRDAFGNSVHRHGHNYTVHVTVAGPVDEDLGFVVDLAAFDALLQEEVAMLDQRDLTEAVLEFAPGRKLPSTENLARWLFERLRGRIPGGARLARVRVDESDTLSAEYWEE
jgi:6-pyruvoyltetrahydropterin/6-carboxytetrahydropterin synthase